MRINPRSFGVNECFVTCTQKRKRVSEQSKTLDFQLQSKSRACLQRRGPVR